jgi:ABC-type transport system involved in cytochrome bd biosynthesis fused ATPase/permease subunit
LWIALDGRMATGDAAAALAALALLILPLRDLSGIWDRHAAWQTAQQRCVRLLATPPLPDKGRRRRRVRSGTPRAAALSFEEAGDGFLDKVSASVAPGQKVGITGRNGAGKSTLLLLAAGLEAPSSGRIRIDGIRSDRLGISARRELVFYQGPRTPILAGSLRRALTLGLRQRPADDVIIAAAARCGLAESVARLGGLDGRLSEAGRNLSAGEIRRVMLARGVLARAPLLLLDEPDDALDRHGRQLIPDLLHSLDSTVLLVSHDWSTLAGMDEVWFVDDGRRLESGSPQALALAGGPTARFFDLGRTA